MKDNISIILITLKGFKRYESITFITYLILSVLYLFDGEFFESLLFFLTCIWVHNSSDWRQISNEYQEILTRHEGTKQCVSR